MILLFLIAFLSFSPFSLVNGKEYGCSGTQNFKNPENGTNILCYPFCFNRDKLPSFSNGNKCQFEIVVAEGYSAKVSLGLNSKNPSGITQPLVQVTNQFGKTEQISTADEEFFFFTAPGGTINLDTQNGKVHFGFAVDWVAYEQENYGKIYVNQSFTVPVMQGTGRSDPITVTADTRVSVTTIAYPAPYSYQFLRGVLIFDGPNIEAPCLGTAYDIYTGNTQFVSTGNKMAIQFLTRFVGSNVPTLLLQDYENTKNIRQFQGMACNSGDYCGEFSLDASKGPVALQSIYSNNWSEPDVITDIDGMGTLEVFIGGVTKNATNAQAIYNAGTSATYLPQTFLGPIKTYVLMNGKATLNITRDPDQFSITKSFGRKGLIASNNYPQLARWQRASGTIQAPIGYSDAKFNVKIASVDLTGDPFFGIYGYKNGTVTFSKVFNSTNLPDMKNGYAISGDSFSVLYDSQQLYTTGLFLRFEVITP